MQRRFFPKSHPVTLRIIGAFGVIACIFTVYNIFNHFELGWIGIIARLLPTVLFWFPASIYLTIKGKLTF